MARSHPYRDHALVIRSYDFGEANRIIVLFTRNHGLVRAVAKGVRRAKSRFGGRLAPFVHLNVQLYPGRNLATITSADTVAFFGSAIISDYERYTAGSAMLEATERLSQAETGDAELFDVLIDALDSLTHSDLPTVELDAFLLQAMGIAGWAPILFHCAGCGCAGPHHAFHPGVGGATCHQCRLPGAIDIAEEVLHYMWLLSHGHRSAAVDMLGDDPSMAHSAHRLTRAHLHWHLERTVSALTIMEQTL